jgi:hypothetical protein
MTNIGKKELQCTSNAYSLQPESRIKKTGSALSVINEEYASEIKTIYETSETDMAKNL